MIEAADLVRAFKRNTRIIEMQADGLSHADSLLQTEHNINCLNWVIGHVVQNRDQLLGALGREAVLPPEVSQRYAQESDPVTEDGPNVLKLEELLELLNVSQDQVAEALGSMTAEDFAQTQPQGERTVTVGSRVHFSYFHDTYHTGQTELLRQIAGTNDKII